VTTFYTLSRVVGRKKTQVCEHSPEGSRGRINNVEKTTQVSRTTLSRVVGGV
jgi:hypothetical protein